MTMCHRLAGEVGVTARGLSLRILWLMAMARREQMRFAMLPHMAGKFDAARFIRTGTVQQRQTYSPPDTPAMRAAYEQAEREQAMIEEMLKHGR